MESYGEILKNTREQKNLEIERISREIAIDSKYLIALEEENSSIFPGEAYHIGFLKNYAKYLGLEDEYLLKLYHNKQIQESPVPEGLIEKPKIPLNKIQILIPSVILIAVIVTVFVLLFVKKSENDENTKIAEKKNTTLQYKLSEEKFSKRVYKGDQLLIPAENADIVLTVKDTLSSFGLDTPSGVFYTDLAEENEIDINGDKETDLIIYVADISSTDETRGAEITALLRHGAFNLEKNNFSDTTELSEIPLSSEIRANHPQKVILEDNRAYPFTINASFRGSCLFRDKIDRNDSVESYFSSGEIFTATARNGIRLWISNSNTVKITIIADSRTYDLDIGPAGQVLVEDIKWIRDSDGRYKLVIIELD